MKNAKKKKMLTASGFIALPDEEKERIYRELDSMTEEQIQAEFKPLNARERTEWREIQKNIRRTMVRRGRGRPKDRADAYARTVMAKKKKISEYERFMALSDAEKDAEVAEFEKYPQGYPLEKTRALNAAERKQWARIKRRIGRPVVGKGAKPFAVTVERDLLAEVDRLAKKRNVKRSELIAEGLRLVLERKTA